MIDYDDPEVQAQIDNYESDTSFVVWLNNFFGSEENWRSESADGT